MGVPRVYPIPANTRSGSDCSGQWVYNVSNPHSDHTHTINSLVDPDTAVSRTACLRLKSGSHSFQSLACQPRDKSLSAV
jgi:hypothetical protein